MYQHAKHAFTCEQVSAILRLTASITMLTFCRYIDRLFHTQQLYIIDMCIVSALLLFLIISICLFQTLYGRGQIKICVSRCLRTCIKVDMKSLLLFFSFI